MYLNLVLDFVPDTVYRVIRQHFKAKQIMPMLYIKVGVLALILCTAMFMVTYVSFFDVMYLFLMSCTHF